MWWALGGVALVVFVFLARAGRRYKRLFAVPHLVEMAQALSRLRQKALSEDPEAPVPPHRLTSAGLVISYSITTDPEGFHHHVSLSHRSGVLALSATVRFAAFLAALGRIDPAAISVASGRHANHIAFALDPAQQQTLENLRPVTDPEAIEELWVGLDPAVSTIHRAMR